MRKLVKKRKRKKQTRSSGRMKRGYNEWESGKLWRWVRVVELSAYPFPLSSLHRLFVHTIQSSPCLNLAETGDFSAKTCTAFYCQIDHLNNSQHGNPSSTMRSVVLSSPSLLAPFSHFSLLLFMIHRLRLIVNAIRLVSFLFAPDMRFMCLRKKISYNVLEIKTM